MSVTLPDGTAITYIHDPNGRRVAKLVNGAVVEKYLWSGLTALLAVYDGSDNLVQRFEYADGRMPYMMTAGGGTYYLAYDPAIPGYPGNAVIVRFLQIAFVNFYKQSFGKHLVM